MPSADPEDSDDVKEAIRTCLRKAALVNYTRLSNYAKVPGNFKTILFLHHSVALTSVDQNTSS